MKENLKCLPPFREIPPTPFAKGGRWDFLGGQGGLYAETIAVARKSPLTPLLQRGEPEKSFSELTICVLISPCKRRTQI